MAALLGGDEEVYDGSNVRVRTRHGRGDGDTLIIQRLLHVGLHVCRLCSRQR